MGGSSRGRPPHIVPIQAKYWMPLGIAMTRLAAENTPSAAAGTPVANMWCTQTPKLMKAIATRDDATQT